MAADPAPVTAVPGYTTPSGLALNDANGYNLVKLAIPLQEMTKARTDVENSLRSIVDSLVAIETVLGELRLGWAGQTADQAKELFDQWNACMTELIGTRSADRPDGTPGAFPRLMTALGSAAANYDRAEDFVVTKLFGPLTAAIGSPPAGAGGPNGYNPPAKDPVTDPRYGVVGERF
ncbi:WXG100 family type VII secretion target [Kitasatospora sp. NPDC056327]|uniref:WXG100 family type VII secretion target n=1 Tax=Kitasatospora sp. NPDC056327 TaxID=3345785 RepID=UPI0035DF494A